MASLRNVRRQLRKKLLAAVVANQGDARTLKRIAREVIGNDVGIEVLLDNLYGSEVSTGMAVLRNEGKVETVGKLWKDSSNLEAVDVDTIALRRNKRMRGELRAQERLAHKYGRTDDAVVAGKMLAVLSEIGLDEAQSTPTPEAAQVSTS